MKVELEVYDALCETKVFKVNDVDADWCDFGDKFDHDRENAEPYCCGDMRFVAGTATQAILDKYKINIDEFNQICEMLSDKLSWGNCGWCS